MHSRHSKQVRFAYKNTFYSAPSTPVVPFSVLSTAPDNMRPSAATYGPRGAKLYERVSYVPTDNIPDSRNRRFATPHRYLQISAICWDLRDHHSTITRNQHSLSMQSVFEPATYPSIPILRLTSPYLPWSIDISASNGAFVTVADVFEAIYRSLRKNITQAEFGLLTSPSDQRRASLGYKERCRRFKGTSRYEREKLAGMKRVDFLLGHIQFVGITNDGRRPDEWHLNIR